ncbi:FeoB small GTPase domain-containing protein, partial [Candidatus Altiarchaeota archaeon]
MKKILLIGNPNVGKSVLFSRLTGVDVVCSNYPGTTVGYCKGSLEFEGKKLELIDAPGTYSLEPTSTAEEIPSNMIEESDLIINVVDATNLERNLLLTHELLHSGKPLIVALNMWDDTRHLGITIHHRLLERILGVPVVPTVAVTGQGVKELVSRLSEAKPGKQFQKGKKHLTQDPKDHEYIWREIGRLIDKVQILEHRHHTLKERLEDASVQPLTGIPIALFVLFLMFQVIISAGNWTIENVLDPIFYRYYGPWMIPLVEGLVGKEGVLHEILLGSGENFIESLGLLTTGLYVPLAMVLPFVVLFYFMLGLLEDVGYLPRLATLSDNVMHHLGLHGTAIVPCILGLGCNVPGALSTRILETRKQRFIASTLLAVS